jgi:hypothetical protein
MTQFEEWYNNRLPGLGSFQLSIFQAYLKADSGNKEKLIQAFPDWFLRDPEAEGAQQIIDDRYQEHEDAFNDLVYSKDPEIQRIHNLLKERLAALFEEFKATLPPEDVQVFIDNYYSGLEAVEDEEGLDEMESIIQDYLSDFITRETEDMPSNIH